jgi:hypothetical protein
MEDVPPPPPHREDFMRRFAITLAGLLMALAGCARHDGRADAGEARTAVTPTTEPTPSPEPPTRAITGATTMPTTVQSPSDAHLAPPRRTGP